MAGNAGAIRFYERLGGVVGGRESKAFFGNETENVVPFAWMGQPYERQAPPYIQRGLPA